MLSRIRPITAIQQITGSHGEPDKTSLKALAAAGTMWTVAGFGAHQAIRLLGNLIVARLLLPRDFGIMALVWLVFESADKFTQLGVGANIVHHEGDLEPGFLNSAWTVQALRSLFLLLIVGLAAGPVARFYHEPLLAQFIPIAGIAFLFDGLTPTKFHILSRDVRINRIMRIEVLAQLLAVIAMVASAVATASNWSLLAGGVIRYAVRMVLSYTAVEGPGNRPAWDREAVRGIFRFGRWLFLATIVAFLGVQFDRFVLGKSIPLDLLGVYSIGSILALMPMQLAFQINRMTLFPVYARSLRLESGMFAEKLVSARTVLLSLYLIIVLGVILAAPAFFSFLYDVRYAQAIWIAQLLSFSVWFMILQDSVEQVFLAQGQTRLLAAVASAALLLRISGSLGGFHFSGLPGFLAGMALGSAAGHGLTLFVLSRRGIRILAMDLRQSLLLFALSGLGYGLTRMMAHRLPISETLAGLAVAAMILTPVSLWALFRLRREFRRHRLS